MWLFDAIIFLIAVCFSLFISVLISQPFTGSLVRLRANYLPKAVSLDNVLEDGGMDVGSGDGDEQQQGLTGGEQRLGGSANGVTPRKISAYFLNQRRQSAKIGPVVSGVFPMLFRTKNLEGWAGVYKGTFPVALQLLLLTCIMAAMFTSGSGNITVGAGGGYKAAPTGPDQFGFVGNLFFMVFFALIALPLNVITYRAIVHPRILPLSVGHIRENLEELLSPAELAQPWRLYTIPGLLPATYAHIAWVGLLTRLVRHILVPNLGGLADPLPASPGDTTYSGPNSSTNNKEVNPIFLALFLAWSAFSVVALSPLEVVAIRLAVQRPERQQPLHLAYSRGGNAPASYSHQATVNPGSSSGGGGPRFSDAAPSTASSNHNKTLPREPTSNGTTDGGDDTPPARPSFAIEDPDEERDTPATATAADASRDPLLSNGDHEGGAGRDSSSATPTPTPADQQQQQQQQQQPPTHPRLRYGEPSEPVIALRPVEEEQNASSSSSETVVSRYNGLKDCLDKIVDEEGVEALYRGAWVTGVGSLLGGLN